MWQISEEQPIIDKDAYYFAIEEFRRGEDQMVFVHLTVHDWSLRTFKEILRNWKLFRSHVSCPLFAVGGVQDAAKWERFVSRLGFKFHSNVVCENGAERRLFIHTKEKEDERQFSTDPTVNGHDSLHR